MDQCNEIKVSIHVWKWCLGYVELLESFKRVGWKWVFKTKHDSKDNIEQYKSRLVA